ncbi:hypothetical protein KI387_012381, partial [Taxus chinensis]
MAAITAPKFFLPDSQLLRSDNYPAWKTKIRAQLDFENLWTVVSGTLTRSAIDVTQQATFDRANQKAKLIILFSVSDEVQPHIRESTTTKESWDKLKTVYESKNKNTILHLQSQLLNLKMQPTEKVEMFLRRVATLRASLQALEEEVTDTSLVPIVLRALPPSYRIFVTTLNIT